MFVKQCQSKITCTVLINAPTLGIAAIINKSNYLSTVLADRNTVYQSQSSGGGEAVTFFLFYVRATGNMDIHVPQSWIMSPKARLHASRTDAFPLVSVVKGLQVHQGFIFVAVNGELGDYNLSVTCPVGGGGVRF